MSALQIMVKEIDSPHAARLTGVICHLIRCTVTNPEKELSAMRQFLRAGRKHIDIFLMEFIKYCDRTTLQFYDPDTREPLPPDDDKLRAAVGLNSKPNTPPQSDKLTFAELKLALNASPDTFMRPLDLTVKALRDVIDSDDPSMLQACSLFMRFTSSFKAAAKVENHVMKVKKIETIREALEFWRPHTLRLYFGGYIEFEICNHGLGVSEKEEHRSFKQRREDFFPSLGSAKPKRAKMWLILWDHGYIHEYHTIAYLSRHRPNHRERIDMGTVDDSLDVLFDHMPCLPIVTAGKRGTADSYKLWQNVDDPNRQAVKVDTNPNYYDLTRRLSTAAKRPLKIKRKLRHDFCLDHRQFQAAIADVQAAAPHTVAEAKAFREAELRHQKQAAAAARAIKKGKKRPGPVLPKVIPGEAEEDSENDPEHRNGVQGEIVSIRFVVLLFNYSSAPQIRSSHLSYRLSLTITIPTLCLRWPMLKRQSHDCLTCPAKTISTLWSYDSLLKSLFMHTTCIPCGQRRSSSKTAF